MGAINTSHYAKSLWSHNPIPRGCVLYLPLWSPGLRGSVFESVDFYRHTCTVTGALWGSQGREFDGADDKIALPDISGCFSTEATLMMWLKLDADLPAETAPTGLAYLGGAATDCHYPLNVSGLIYLDVLRSARVDSIDDGAFDKAEWHLFTVTSKEGANNWIFYQNITVVKTDTGDASVSIPATGKIGESQNSNYNLDGLIGEVWLYNRALSAAEVAHSYNVTRWRYN